MKKDERVINIDETTQDEELDTVPVAWMDFPDGGELADVRIYYQAEAVPVKAPNVRRLKFRVRIPPAFYTGLKVQTPSEDLTGLVDHFGVFVIGGPYHPGARVVLATVVGPRRQGPRPEPGTYYFEPGLVRMADGSDGSVMAYVTAPLLFRDGDTEADRCVMPLCCRTSLPTFWVATMLRGPQGVSPGIHGLGEPTDEAQRKDTDEAGAKSGLAEAPPEAPHTAEGEAPAAAGEAAPAPDAVAGSGGGDGQEPNPAGQPAAG